MKQLLWSLLFSTLIFSSCKKDDAPTITTTNVTSTVSNGSWRITYYAESSVDKTSNYSGYSFTFASGGVITATKTATTVSGTWSTGNDNSTVKLVLAFTTPTLFSDLSDDWHVLERTDTKIRTQHVSGGSGTTDYLTFDKN